MHTVHLDNIKVFLLPNRCTSELYFRTVQRTHTNKDPLIYAATSPHTDVP